MMPIALRTFIEILFLNRTGLTKILLMMPDLMQTENILDIVRQTDVIVSNE